MSELDKVSLNIVYPPARIEKEYEPKVGEPDSNTETEKSCRATAFLMTISQTGFEDQKVARTDLPAESS